MPTLSCDPAIDPQLGFNRGEALPDPGAGLGLVQGELLGTLVRGCTLNLLGDRLPDQ